MKRTRVGVIGTGRMGAKHARALAALPEVELVGVADHHHGRADEVAGQSGATSYYDYRDLLPRLDCAVVAASTAAHGEIGADCARAGVHILLEKPMCLTVAEAETLLNEVGRAGVILMVGHTELFNPAVAELRRRVAGEQVLSLLAERLAPSYPPTEALDVITNLMVHDLAVAGVLLQTTGAPVFAWGQRVQAPFLDYATASVSYGRAVGCFLASYLNPHTVRTLAVHGLGWFAEVDYLHRTLRMAEGDRELQTVTVPDWDPLQHEIRHFLGCIHDGHKPESSGLDGLRLLRLSTALRDTAMEVAEGLRRPEEAEAPQWPGATPGAA